MWTPSLETAQPDLPGQRLSRRSLYTELKIVPMGCGERTGEGFCWLRFKFSTVPEFRRLEPPGLPECGENDTAVPKLDFVEGLGLLRRGLVFRFGPRPRPWGPGKPQASRRFAKVY